MRPRGESDDDLVVTTNHYIVPRMQYAVREPLIAVLYGMGPLQESEWRYESTVELVCYCTNEGIMPLVGENGDYPEPGSAGRVCDMLNPNHQDQGSIPTSFFYMEKGKPLDGEVEGHPEVYDNTQREMRALFGYVDDPWVGVKPASFSEWADSRAQEP